MLQAIFWVALVFLAVALYAANRFLKPFFWRITFCLTPLVIAAVLAINAVYKYEQGEGGFKLGVDLVGGTILVYEVDKDRQMADKDYDPALLAASLKKRIDPADLYNVTIRPVSNTRVEIILPTGGRHQIAAEKRSWEDLLAKVAAKWPVAEKGAYDVGNGKVAELVNRVREHNKDVDAAEVQKFIDQNYQASHHVTNEYVEEVKDRISRVGSLEFRILANNKDDSAAIAAAQKFFADAKTNEQTRRELEARAIRGQPPPTPPPPTPAGFSTPLGTYTYSWVEVGKKERATLNLSNASENTPEWKRAAEAREKGEPYLLTQGKNGEQILIYSRKSLAQQGEKNRDKRFDYFILTRNPEKGKEITGEYLTSAQPAQDRRMQPAVGFHFNAKGGSLFYELTSKNASESKGEGYKRYLATILDGQIEMAPALNSPISTDGIIESDRFTAKEVNEQVRILRSGALPATLKSQPVSENTMGATLGEDTIHRGTTAVGWAFVAVLAFMVIYYRFAGLVASVALLANLLLTVAFMVAVQATFTLPGLAGLVLMLGMAVDANVLIYERLREERERGASLALAIRNGYDRAFPTIIDTHLSSIFTAIVLYAVGNDQLKGFGVSLTVGLIISLFTSLYMTRLLFDLWLSKNWLHKLSMLRLFARPNIDFMGIRYYWFTATILLTLFGLTVFLVRGKDGLNIDFVGGTAYGGQLVQPMDIAELRKKLGDDRQKEVLAIPEGGVTQLGDSKRDFEITYKDGAKRRVALPNDATPEDVRQRASVLPDYSVEQIFLASKEDAGGTKEAAGTGSRYFTVRTSEKAADLVQAAIVRLLGPDLYSIRLASYQTDPGGRSVKLHFTDPKGEAAYASPGQVTTLLQKEFEMQGLPPNFRLDGEGEAQEGRFQSMKLELIEPINPEKLKTVLEAVKAEFAARPQPDRLENFDSQLAAETQTRALYAIIASWAAILMYLWFRFGSWTFGLAAVLCLIHDLFFTLGIIAFCHYIHDIPWLANALMIQDFKIDLPAVAALLTLVGYSVNDTIVVFDRIREVRGRNPDLTPQMINDSVNQTLSRTILASLTTWLVVIVLYIAGGEGVHLFAFVMVVGVIVGTYSSIYIASPLLLIFGEGRRSGRPVRERPAQTQAQPVG